MEVSARLRNFFVFFVVLFLMIEMDGRGVGAESVKSSSNLEGTLNKTPTRRLLVIAKQLRITILKLKRLRVNLQLSTSHTELEVTHQERSELRNLTKAIRRMRSNLRNILFRIKFRRTTFRTASDNIFRRSTIFELFHKCGSRFHRFRNIDGSCNHKTFVNRGATGSPFQLLTYRGFSKKPSGSRPSAREVSNIVHHDVKTIKNRRTMSEIVVFFGQFLDHTLTEFAAPKEEKKRERFNIPIPNDDRVFKNVTHIEFIRSEKKRTRRGYAAVNELPSYIDVAATYGNGRKASNQLRSFKDGLLLTSSTRLSTNMIPQDDDGFFLGGDPRVNENPALTAFHTLFMRSHNTLAAEVKRAFPWYNDELVFQMARKINGALQQSITYYEFLPTVLGSTIPFNGPFRGSGRANPTISDEFSVMAFRVGHTLVNERMTFIRKNGTKTTRLLSEVFSRPSLFRIYTVEDLFRGMVHTRAAEVDVQVNSQLWNFLFSRAPDARPLDLVSLNLRRGRDHRLPSYVQLRRRFGLPKIHRFSQITRNRRVQHLLRKAYGDVSLIDGFTGGLAEDQCCGGSLGPLFRRIWINQFQRLRSGDRFYFEKRGGFSARAIATIPTLRLLMTGKLRGRTLQYMLEKNTDISISDLYNVWQAFSEK